MAAGITRLQVRVDQMVSSRGVAIVKEISTNKSMEVGLLPMRAGRMPVVGETWLLDRTFEAWTFAALLNSPNGFTAPGGGGSGDGADGDSAYEVAVNNGFVGTEAQWLASLEGEPGQPGPASTVPGPPGPPNSLSIGTVTTGAPGAPAAASITGSAPVQQLHLTIPQGTGGGTGGGAVVDGSVWHAAAGAPSSGVGEVTDFYLNTSNGDVYEKTTSTVWTYRGNIRGPQGIPGPEGEVLIVELTQDEYYALPVKDPDTLYVITDAMGVPGPPGEGVPTGGATGQMLVKAGSADYNTAWATPIDAEAVRDLIGTTLVQGANVTITVNDAGDTVTIAATGSSGLDLEAVQDAVAAMITDSATVTKTYDDTTGTLTLTATSSGGGGGYRGEWNSGTAYLTGQEVSSAGALWAAMAPNTGSVPSTTRVLASAGANAVNGDWAWFTGVGGAVYEIAQPIRLNADTLVGGIDLGFYSAPMTTSVEIGITATAPSGAVAPTLITTATTVSLVADGTSGLVYWSRAVFTVPLQLSAGTDYYVWVRDIAANNFDGQHLIVNDGAPPSVHTVYSGVVVAPTSPIGKFRAAGGVWANLTSSRNFTFKIISASALDWERIAIEDVPSHTQTASTITDLTEVVQDVVAAMVTNSATVTKTYDDTTGTLTLTATAAGGLDLEAVQDAVASMITDSATVTKTYDDTAGTLTLTATGSSGGSGTSTWRGKWLTATYAAGPPSTATASSTLAAGWEPWRSFNGGTGSGDHWASANGAVTGEWLAGDWGAPFKLVTYTLSPATDGWASAMPKSWVVQGSNDGGTTWIDVDTRSGITWVGTTPQTFTISGTPSAYSRYRMANMAGGISYTMVGDWALTAGANPYMIGQYVTHLGRLWISNSDNNSGVPGTSGWTEVPWTIDSADIPDLTETVQDVVAAMITDSATVTKTYNDAAGTLTLTAPTGGGGGGLDAEAVRDLIGATLVQGANITITVDDAGDTVTIAAAPGLDLEAVQDAVGAMVTDSPSIIKTYNDTAGTLTLTALSFYKGDWNSTTTYLTNQAVSSGGALWIAKADNTNVLPALAPAPTVGGADGGPGNYSMSSSLGVNRQQFAHPIKIGSTATSAGGIQIVQHNATPPPATVEVNFLAAAPTGTGFSPIATTVQTLAPVSAGSNRWNYAFPPGTTIPLAANTEYWIWMRSVGTTFVDINGQFGYYFFAYTGVLASPSTFWDYYRNDGGTWLSGHDDADRHTYMGILTVAPTAWERIAIEDVSVPSSAITDLTEVVQDTVAAMITDSATVTKTYNDAAGTLSLTAAGGGGGGGSSPGSVAPAITLGETATTATWTSVVANRCYYKQIVIPPGGGLLTSIAAYVDNQQSPGNVTNLSVAVHEHDPEGGTTDPVGKIIETTSPKAVSLYLAHATARWVNVPVSQWLPAGTYWIGMQSDNAIMRLNVSNASGTDRTIQPTGGWFSDGFKAGSGYPISAVSGVSWAIQAKVLVASVTGGTNPWLSRIDLPLTTLTGWTVGNGAWVTTSGQIEQTTTSASPKRLQLNLPVDTKECVVEVELKVASPSGLHQAGFIVGYPGGDSTNGLGIQLHRPDNGAAAWTKVTVEEEGVTGAATITLPAAVTNTAYVKLRAEVAGDSVSIYVNDVYVTTTRDVGKRGIAATYIGLLNYGCDVTYRNLKVWTPAGPTEPGTPSTIKDARWKPPTGWTVIDEFETDTLNPAWLRVDGTGAETAKADWVQGNGVMSLNLLGNDSSACLHGMVVPSTDFAVGDALVTCMDIMTILANYFVPGLVLSSSPTYGSGTQIRATAYIDSSATSGAIRPGMSNHTGWNTAGGAASGEIALNNRERVFIRVVKTAATTWRMDASPNGIHWRQVGSPMTHSFTVSHVGFFGTTYGTAASGIASFEFLRRMSGVT